MKLESEQRHVIIVVTLGGVLEWFDIYSFAYLAPILGKLFFNFNRFTNDLLGALTLFGVGFISRPFGAIIFGRIGDLIGRRRAYISSILMMTIPTFFMGFLPTYSSWGIWAPTLFYLLRFLQSVPASGEIPGSICYLYENANKNNIKYLTSWTFVGNQIGAVLGLTVAVMTEWLLSDSMMMTWGWRISFWLGGLLGLLAVYFRHTLMETPIFKKLKSHHHIDNETIRELINNHKVPIIWGVGFGALLAATFYIFATYIPVYFGGITDVNSFYLSWIIIALIIFMTMFIPIFGSLAEKFSSKKMLVYSSIFIVLLLIPLYLFLNSKNIIGLIILGCLFPIPISCIAAVYPYWVAHIFHPKVRYTGVGLAFNLAGSFIGGLSPAIALLMVEDFKNPGAFCWYVLVWAIVSIISYLKIRDKKTRSV